MIRKLTPLSILALLLVFCSGSQASGLSANPEKHYQSLAQEIPQNTAKEETGATLYTQYCLSCHQKDGSGVPNMYPPILKSDWVNGDKNKIINVLLNGLTGDIEVNGDSYSQVMPKQNYLTDVQVALLLTYIRQNFENSADAVIPADVAKLREKK